MFTRSCDLLHSNSECSSAGKCDRSSGRCECFNGYEGDACQRKSCFSDCSGHGSCVSMRRMATMEEAQPTSAATTYVHSNVQWDADMLFGCVCDSSWSVGLGASDTQQAEYFGPDCSLKRCPSGDDPITLVDETDGTVAANAGVWCSETSSHSGNKCHVDCSNRGHCDHSTATCTCFEGFYGASCNSIEGVVPAS